MQLASWHVPRAGIGLSPAFDATLRRGWVNARFSLCMASKAHPWHRGEAACVCLDSDFHHLKLWKKLSENICRFAGCGYSRLCCMLVCGSLCTRCPVHGHGESLPFCNILPQLLLLSTTFTTFSTCHRLQGHTPSIAYPVERSYGCGWDIPA